METYAVIAAIWLSLLGLYYAWPYLRRPSTGFRRQRPVRTRIISTSYLQDEPELRRRFEHEIEEAKAALERPAQRRGPVISETVPSQHIPLAVPRRPAVGSTYAEPRVDLPPSEPEPVREPAFVAAPAATQPADESPFEAPFEPPERPYELSEPAFVAAMSTQRPAVVEMSEEVDLLRAQVEQLREELVEALSIAPVPPLQAEPASEAPSQPRQPVERYERPYLRRYRTGAYTQLPRPLRQQVSAVRSRRIHV